MYVQIKNLGDWHGLVNVGMVKELYLIRHDDVEFIINNGDCERVPLNGISLKVDSPITKMDFAANRCTFSEPTDDTDHGLMYMPAIVFELPRLNFEVKAWLGKNKTRRFLAIWRDGNANWYLTGSKDYALKLKYDKVVEAENKFMVNLSAESKECTFQLAAGFVLEESFSNVEFSSEFSFDYNS